jgi:uncharacterized membrane protein YfcA
MLSIKTWIFITLGGFAAFYLVTWLTAIRRNPDGKTIVSDVIRAGIGFVTNFFDTLGIGSFATTTSFFRVFKLVKDEVIPGTLNVGHTLPTITQAFIYILIIKVEMTTLIMLIAASVLGMWLGSGVTSKLPRRKIQLGMGVALLVAATLLLMDILKKQAEGGLDLGLHGYKLWIGVIGNFVLGALMSLGIGLYGPCLIMISLLGMSPETAFPIMMGSCAFLMPVGSAQFVRKGSYDLRAALWLALGGIPAVLIAAKIVEKLNLYYVKWLVVVVVVYTALSMLWSAIVERRSVIAKQEA